MAMTVEFYKDAEGRTCSWIATPPRRKAFRGTTMAAGRDLPHDLMQFVIESKLGLREGFWGLLASGGSFRSVPGRKPTRAGQQLVRSHHDALMVTEGIVNAHYAAWRNGAPTPVGPALDVMYARWLALGAGERLVAEWSVAALPTVAPHRRQLGRHRAPASRARR